MVNQNNLFPKEDQDLKSCKFVLYYSFIAYYIFLESILEVVNWQRFFFVFVFALHKIYQGKIGTRGKTEAKQDKHLRKPLQHHKKW